MPKLKKSISFATKTAAANALGIDRSTFIAWTGKPGFPAGSLGPWALTEIIPWILTRQRLASSDDPLMLDGPDSPNLERFRAAKAALAELELGERAATLLDRSKTRIVFDRLGGILRRLGERLGKRFGNDAAQMMNDSLFEFHSIVNFELGDEQSDAK
jgi:hypothetical protein